LSFGKKLEIAFKNIISKTLKSILQQEPQVPHPPYNKVLFIRYGGIGDMILSIPVFGAVRGDNPNAIIDVLCDRKNVVPLLDSNVVDSCFFYDKKVHLIIKLIIKLKQKNYDYIVNMVMYPSFTFSFIGRLIGPQSVRVGADQHQFSFYYNRFIELPPKTQIHMLDRLLMLSSDLVCAPKESLESPWVEYNRNIKDKARNIFLQLCKDQSINPNDARIAAINLSAGLKRREWPLEKYKELVNRLNESHSKIIEGWAIITDPLKPEKAEELSKSLMPEKIFVLPIINDFRVIMEFLRYVFVLITPDTSISHAASAMGTPELVLMIGENLITWAPKGNPHQIVASKDPYNLEDLPVEDVLKGFDILMSKLPNKKID
jgi:ADP-heptose:LPS heptosyltransferase